MSELIMPVNVHAIPMNVTSEPNGRCHDTHAPKYIQSTACRVLACIPGKRCLVRHQERPAQVNTTTRVVSMPLTRAVHFTDGMQIQAKECFLRLLTSAGLHTLQDGTTTNLLDLRPDHLGLIPRLLTW